MVRTKEQSKSRKKIRIDMVIEKLTVIDKEKGVFGFTLVPDPKVWELTKINDEEGYLNKKTNIFIPMSEFENVAKTMKGLPVYAHTIRLDSKKEYLKRSRKRLKERSPPT